ncbi:hypothetical protein J2J97_08410 [Rhizobium bangladeshense]|uniref:hypothetical protein n=1 Tax=Rhizobium bangladeshense TaxID=1138189 RepID=UPI001A98AE95|nr:hypothetical protein [Rhizobium bangladeshense]QSY95918.1 hypothetical protein J2J97_08410 [Rhizobium bangladeshense]
MGTVAARPGERRLSTVAQEGANEFRDLDARKVSAPGPAQGFSKKIHQVLIGEIASLRGAMPVGQRRKSASDRMDSCYQTPAESQHALPISDLGTSRGPVGFGCGAINAPLPLHETFHSNEPPALPLR